MGLTLGLLVNFGEGHFETAAGHAHPINLRLLGGFAAWRLLTIHADFQQC
jgi:hypothetical protein